MEQFLIQKTKLELRLNAEQRRLCGNYVSDVLWNVDRGCLDRVEYIAKAIKENSKLFYYEYSMSKSEIDYIYNSVASELLRKINSYRGECDNFFRRISALKLLGINNDELTKYVSGSSYCKIAKYLADLENGDPNRSIVLETLAWLISEYYKGSNYCGKVMPYHHLEYEKKRRAPIIRKVLKDNEELYFEAIVKDAIEGVCKKLKEKRNIREYSQLFHLLTLLGVPRNTLIVPETGENVAYDIAYFLWWLDIEKDIEWENIENIIEYLE